jgi:hypothetical protein
MQKASIKANSRIKSLEKQSEAFAVLTKKKLVKQRSIQRCLTRQL